MTSATCYELSVNWNSQYAKHNDRLIIPQIHQQNDPMMQQLEKTLLALAPDESTDISLLSNNAIPAYSTSNIYDFESNFFKSNQRNLDITPTVGRFYPQGFIAQALNVNRNNYTPFRLTQIKNNIMTADTNHPLSHYPVRLNARCLDHPVSACKSAQPSADIFADLLNSGPGLQVPCQDVETDFYYEYPFKCEKQQDDSEFYQQPRLIQHLDNCAIEQVKQIYQRLLKPGDRILDLMSSVYSHIPEQLENYQATGLGMNEVELSRNTQLNDFIVHDLNKNPQLPFRENSFDAVICTSSIEYLTQPIQVLKQLAAVCKPGASVVFTFSTRWFPGKQIKLWSEMHPFERQGLVLDLFVKSGCFTQFESESIRGFARPSTDRHYPQTKLSDPVFAVWGKVK